MARWAWHAYKWEQAPDYPVIRDLEARVYSFTDATFPSVQKCLPPDEYATGLLNELHRVGCVHPGTDDVLDGLRGYTEKLIRPDADPLRDLCGTVLNATLATYADFGVDLPDPRLGLHAEPLMQRPWKTFPSPFNADARVEPGCRGRCCKATQEHLQSLRLSIAPASFDAGTLAALPFALFHECVSHVMQGPHTLSRRVPDKGSEFAEGWMDRAAWAVFERALSQKRLPLYPHGNAFHREGGTALYQGRRSTEGDHDVRAAARRDRGWKAASNLHQLYQEELGFPDPDLPFLRLSFRLNVSDVAPEHRDSAVATLLAVLKPRHHRRVQSLWAPLTNALIKFDEDTDLDALLEVIEDVRRQITLPFS
jgi:hypothetical protein